MKNEKQDNIHIVLAQLEENLKNVDSARKQVKSVVESTESLINVLNKNYELVQQLNHETSNLIKKQIDFSTNKLIEIKNEIDKFSNQAISNINGNLKQISNQIKEQINKIESNIKQTSTSLENQIVQTTNKTKKEIDNYINQNKETILQLKNETLKVLNSLYETQVETKKILNELYSLNLPQKLELFNTNLTNLSQNHTSLMNDFQKYKTKYFTNNKLMFILIFSIFAFQLFMFIYKL